MSDAAETTRIAMVLFPRLTQLDLTGPYEVLARMPGARVDLLHHELAPVASDRGLMLTPTATFRDYRLPADILFIPGGPGQLAAMEDEALLDFVRRAGAAARYVTSVCTGSLLLGAAGLLVGKRATTHWAVLEQLALLGAEPVKARVVVDGNTMTGAGVSAGLDFALALAAELHGREAAERIQLMIEYDPAPPFQAGAPEKAPAATLAALRQATAELTQKRAEVAARIGREQLGLGRPS
jgi:cyclohexyl-isocyanide hydratase